MDSKLKISSSSNKWTKSDAKNAWPPRIESDGEKDEIKKRIDAILKKHRENPSGALSHFIRQCESSARLEEEGLKDKD
jgi:uncharacterized membrane protein YheB (UPF0754 family)